MEKAFKNAENGERALDEIRQMLSLAEMIPRLYGTQISHYCGKEMESQRVGGQLQGHLTTGRIASGSLGGGNKHARLTTDGPQDIAMTEESIITFGDKEDISNKEKRQRKKGRVSTLLMRILKNALARNLKLLRKRLMSQSQQ